MVALGETSFEGMEAVAKGAEVLGPRKMIFEGMEDVEKGFPGVCTRWNAFWRHEGS